MRIVLALLLTVAPAFAQDGETVTGAREAKHMITPFVGYQAINGEQMGLDYSVEVVNAAFPDTTFHFTGSYKAEHSSKPPVLGIAYRYLVMPHVQIEGAFSFLQDKADFKYPIALDFYGYVQERNIKVHHTSLTALNLDGLYTVDSPLDLIKNIVPFEMNTDWLGLAFRVGVGYAWRDISTNWRLNDAASSDVGVTSSLNVKDSKQLLTVRGGCDLFVWSSDNLLLQGGITYTNFIPMKGDFKAFDGFGWRIAAFPVWSASPGE